MRDPNKEITEGLTVFGGRSVEGPLFFVVGPKLWSRMSAHLQGCPVKMQAENILGGTVLLSPYLTGDFELEAYMVSQRGGDFEIILGNDLSIGYDSHTTSAVALYFTESFTFTISDVAGIIHFTAQV